MLLKSNSTNPSSLVPAAGPSIKLNAASLLYPTLTSPASALVVIAYPSIVKLSVALFQVQSADISFGSIT